MSNQIDYKTVGLTEPFSDAERKKLDAFRFRFRELWRNFDDLRKSGLNLSGHFKLEPSGAVSSDVDLGVSHFRIKGFLVDYRHFHGDEPSNFLTVLKAVRRRCRDEVLNEPLTKIKTDWTRLGTLSGWHNDFTLDEVLDAVFKENVFHTVTKVKNPRVRLEDVEEKLSSSAVWYEITSIAYQRMLVIRNLNWILEPIFNGMDELRLPTK